MPETTLEDLKKTSKRITQDIRNEARGFFHLKTRRERYAVSKKITIDPFSFLIGGIGSVAVGIVTDEGRHREEIDNDGTVGAALRTLAYPIRTTVRFFAGGCIYVVIDAFISNALEYRAPYISGALTGTLFALGSTNSKNLCRPPVFFGAVMGMSIFAQLADLMFDIYINNG